MSNYEPLIRDNLAAAFSGGSKALASRLPAELDRDALLMPAFGGACRITPEAVSLDGKAETGPRGLVISLYASHASVPPMHLEPLVAFREFEGSMPYQGAFAANSERPLIPRAKDLQARKDVLCRALGVPKAVPKGIPGDFFLVLSPLPKITLCYIVYLPDDEFPASVTCLFSSNARSFMPLDGLADTAEYTTRKILDLIDEAST